MLVVDPSLTVEVTVKVVEVPWRELSVELTLAVRPERVIQLALGEIESVSVQLQPDSCVQAGIVQEYGPEPIE